MDLIKYLPRIFLSGLKEIGLSIVGGVMVSFIVWAVFFYFPTLIMMIDYIMKTDNPSAWIWLSVVVHIITPVAFFGLFVCEQYDKIKKKEKRNHG